MSDLIIYNSPDGKVKVSLLQQEGNVWLNQNQLAELFATSKQNIGLHIKNILQDKELDEKSVVKYFFTTAADGKNYNTAFYKLEMILAIGFRLRNLRGVQFRQWANQHLQIFLQKGFLIDKERLKNPDGRPDYFDELLAEIREIRASEKRFYQKVRDLFALSQDYQKDDKATQMFFAETQNKLIYAVTGKTAAELIVSRAAADKPNMALTSWQGSKVRKQDIFTAKNYLTADELDSLNRLVIIFLETAEFRAKNRQSILMDFWRQNVDKILLDNEQKLLDGKGSISNKQMQEQVSLVYEKFNQQRRNFEARLADEQDLQELSLLEKELKNR
ncbi:MAG: virulence RhuM family protein [Cardiobacteriaceae bacterium]|nr:virulence RhuM family protein [Cardiobacteriaceae bacterium]